MFYSKMIISQETGQDGNIADFIKKLLNIIHVTLILSQSCSEVISFSENGKQVLIHDLNTFVDVVLPTYFRHSQWRSFIRQMNMYDFKKLNRGYNCFKFIHPLFYNGNDKNYHLIRRKIKSKSERIKETQNREDQTKMSLEYSYPNTTISSFFKKIIEFRNNSEDCYNEIKKSVNLVCQERKEHDCKQINSGVKDCVQLI